MNRIPVFYSFARSGGTLVNQLLGAHPQCLVLSEVNPAASYKSIAEQAVEWLGLIAAHEVEDFSYMPYHRQINLLYTRAAVQGKQLIIRDWVTVNFLAGSAGNNVVPSGQIEQELYLEYAGFESVPLIIARRGAAVYGSIKHNFSHLQDLEEKVFAEAYLEYARAVAKFPKIHMEALRAHPDTTLLEILRRFDLVSHHRSSLLQNFHDFRSCTGNTTLQVSSESASARQILPPETLVSQETTLTDTYQTLDEADRLLGYD